MELIINFTVWIGAVFFSLYKVYAFGKDVDTNPEFFNDFAPGWNIIGRSKDVSDYEWNSWKVFTADISPWILLHICISELIRNHVIKLQIWYILLSFTFIVCKFGSLAFFFMLVQPTIYFIILKVNGTSKFIWIWSCLFLLVMNIFKKLYEADNKYYLTLFNLNEDSIYLMLVATSWIQLRCISYSLEFTNVEIKKSNNKINNISFISILSYSFYLPLLFLGPVILYDDFQKSFSRPVNSSFNQRLYNLSINLCRFLGWFIFTELSLHYIYFNALQYDIEIVKIMPDWCLYGGGLWMGLYFYLKYLITYGIAGSFAALDNIKPETPPLCIARVHLYSQMWKYFDVGLHKFLIRYIYKPIINNIDKSKLILLTIVRSLASLLCFTFVLFWHGAHYFIFIWTLLNFLGITIENTAMAISELSSFKSATTKIFTFIVSKDRFYAILSTPILIVSALSNFYFFAGSEVGDVYVDRVFSQSLNNFIVMFVCLYCCCRISQFVHNVKVRKIL